MGALRLLPLLLQLLGWLSLPFLTSAAYFDLSELSWSLSNENGSIVVPGNVPSQAHLDLLKANVITEPLLEINDFTQRWVWMDNWTYTADLGPFFESIDANNGDQTLLVFYGLDTIANITFADVPIAWVNNQFRQYVFDLTPHISSTSQSTTDRNLTLQFESAYWYGLNISSRADSEFYPGGNGVFEIPAARHYIRKQSIDFGWDWSPAFAPSGIFKPAYIVTLSDPSNSTNSSSSDTLTLPASPPFSPTGSTNTTDFLFVEEYAVDIYKLGSNFSVPPDQTADWVVNVTFSYRSASELDLTLALALPELELSNTVAISPRAGEDGVKWATVLWNVPDDKPTRWYPHNLATGPTLYNLTGSLALSNASSGTPLVEWTTRTGFRTIRLNQLPVPQSDVDDPNKMFTPGDQYHFEINGQPFYVMGTNLVPFDPFYPRIGEDAVKWVLESVVMSGQNMVRVWGGGIYQPTSPLTAGGVYSFYSLCDELGILAWSEFLFSDALSPINPFFLESVLPEIQQNVRRANQHPSVAQWAGGNEIEGIVISTNNSLDNGTIYLNEFVTMFQDFLHDLETGESRSVPYTDCSTTKGVLSLDPYILRFDNGTKGDIYGNDERFDYTAGDAFDYNTYPVARFVNEFGFHSMPSIYTWTEALTSPSDFSFNSTVVASRDHHPPAGSLAFPNPNAPEGQAEMTLAVQMWLPAPNPNLTASPDPTQNAESNLTFAQWCYSTQVFQSMTITSEIAWYRHGAGHAENNLGGIVWQLNDIWQGVSWSSVEYSGRWKILNYGLTNAYSPLLVHPFWFPGNESLIVRVMSDRWESVQGTVQTTWFDWEGNVLNGTTNSTANFSVDSLNSVVISEQLGLDNILPEGKGVDDVWMMVNLTAEVDGKTVKNEGYFTPTSLVNASLVDPKIQVTSSADLTFTLSAKGGVAPFAWIEHPMGTVGVFVDPESGIASNGWYLVPGMDRSVKFVLNAAISTVTDPDLADFVVRSLWNNTLTGNKATSSSTPSSTSASSASSASGPSTSAASTLTAAVVNNDVAAKLMFPHIQASQLPVLPRPAKPPVVPFEVLDHVG